MDEYKKLYARKNVFKKKIYLWDFESFIFWSKFRFLGGLLYDVFASIFFPIFRRPPVMLVDIFTHRKTVVVQLIEEIESNAQLLFRVPLINSNKISPCSSEFTFVRKR